MTRRRLASVTVAATAAAVGVCLNAAVAFADSSDSATSSQSQPPARTAQQGAESGTSSGHRGARLPRPSAALRPSQPGAPDARAGAGPALPDLPQKRLAALPSAQPSDGPPPSAVRTGPVLAAPASVSGPLPGAAPIKVDQTMSAVAVNVPDSRPTVPASLLVERAESPAAPAPTAAQPAVATNVGQPGPAVTVLPAPPPSITAVPAPAPGTSLVVAVSRFLTSLSNALSGNTIPADTALGVMSEAVRRGRFAPATATGPVPAATTTSSVTMVVEAEKMVILPGGAGRVVNDSTASAGSALALTGSGTATARVTVPTGTTGLVIRARTSSGGPTMTLAVDGVPITTLMVTPTGWTEYTFAGVVPAGSHDISVSTTTATTSYTLYLDKLSTITGSISDDFTGKYGSAPSEALWGRRSGSGFDGGIQTYSTGNVFLDGQGHLVIQATRAKGGRYNSGWAWSKNDVSYGYGTITASIKMPKGQGIWPAFWLMGADSDTIGWPASGEIDVVELPSTTTTLYSTLHGPITGTTATQQAQIVSTLPDLSTDYHNYWVRHLEDEVTFGIDSKTLGTLTPASLGPGEQWVYNRPMYINLNVAVGGAWAGAPNSSTPFPAKMLVDSVRWDPPA